VKPSEAFELLVGSVKGSEGLALRAYPDPASPLYVALAKAGLIRAYMAGKAEIPADLRDLSGAPWTNGYGETEGVKEGDVWTRDYAELRLRHKLVLFLAKVYAKCPALHQLEPERASACTSLAYNIGLGAFGASSVCRFTTRGQLQAAADAFRLWNKAGGRVLAGLTARRAMERLIYLLQYPRS
jgi:lysozyme